MKYLICVFVLFSLSHSYSQSTAKRENSELNLTTTQPKINLRKIPKTWKSLSAIQQEWIKVEKDNHGYLIYEPCDGSTETIKFEKGFLMINGRIEGDRYYYEKFTLINGNSSFRLDASNLESKEGFEIKAKIVDYKNGIVLWELNEEKWLMTPKENFKSFRIIKNNCKTEKKPELQFLPIEDYK